MSRLRYAGLSGTVPSLTNSATSLTFPSALVYGTSSSTTNVPTLTGTDYFLLTILDSTGGLSEVVKVTAYNSSTLAATIVRAQEGTTGVSHSSGDKVTQAVYPSEVLLNKDPRWTPLSGQTSIDEFNTGSLGSAWTRVDGTNVPSSALTISVGGDVLSFLNAGTGDVAGAIHGLVQPLSGVGGSLAAGDGFVTYMDVFNDSNNYVFFGLLLSDGTTYGSGKQVAGIGGTGLQFQIWEFTSWTSRSQAGGSTLPYIAPVPRYVRLAMISTSGGSQTYRVDGSTDGVQWMAGPTIVSTMVATQVGFCDTNYGSSNKHNASFDMIRRVSGVT